MLIHIPLTTFVLLHSSLAVAQDHSLNTTEERVGWVDPSYGRGTFNLIGGCLWTIIITTWCALHLNLPSDEDSRFGIRLRRWKWLLVGMVAPEVLATAAAGEFCSARAIIAKMRPLYGEQTSLTGQRESKRFFTMSHAFMAVAGGYTLFDQSGDRFRLSANMLYDLAESGEMELPHHPEDEIRDKSKFDSLTRVIAIFQIGWLIAQLIARFIEKLAIPLLELLTLGTVITAFAAYAFWWSKPLDVEEALLVRTQASIADMRQSTNEKGGPLSWTAEDDRCSLRRPRNRGKRISLQGNNHVLTPLVWVILLFVFLAFGACHLLAWNFSFPSQTEQDIWRLGSILCMALGATFLSVKWFSGKVAQGNFRPKWKPFGLRSWEPVEWVILTLYVVVRVYLLFEIGYSLRSAPVGVYKSIDWPGFLKHL